MTDGSVSSRGSAPRYRLRTFGTLSLAGPTDDTLLGKHRHQHRRLALLAVLAVTGEEGRSRDQLHALFWPDATQARARHSLEQLLYAIRSSIDEDVFEHADPVRLNSEVIGSDVADFIDALEKDDLERAVGIYRGEFLDGFYLNDAPEFEHWLDGARTRIGRRFSEALEQLAGQAVARQNHDAAVSWHRRLAETDPVSATYATGLIRALMSAGDHAAALRYAEQYGVIVARELGTSAGPAVASLVAEARATTQSASVAAEGIQLPSKAAIQSPRSVMPAPDTPVQPRSRVKPRVWYAAGIFSLLIGAAAWLSARSERQLPIVADRSIAVLPFVNLSGDQADAPLVDGISEEMIVVLNRIPDLRVVPRTSAFAFRDTRASLRTIADSLGVSSILEGSVQKAGSHLRVRVRLVDGATASTRWSETYDRELDHIFSVQAEIAGAVARELDLRIGESALSRIRRPSTTNIAAYELYLRGNDPIHWRSDNGAKVGLDYFRRAIALDPDYSAAYAGLAKMHLRIGFGGDSSISRTERLVLAERAALKAVALDESSGEAHAALGRVKRNSYDVKAAEAEFKRAIELEPANPHFREARAALYTSTGRASEALVESLRAVELDPLSPTANAEVAHALLASRRCEESLARLAKLSSLRPPLNRASAIAAQCHLMMKRSPLAIAEMERVAATSGPRGRALLGYMLARGGRVAEARTILAEMIERSRTTNGDAFDVAIVYAGLGDADRAMTWLERSVDDHSFGFEWLPHIMDEFRRYDGFHRVGARTGLMNR